MCQAPDIAVAEDDDSTSIRISEDDSGDDEEDIVIRAKWIMDDAKTLDEAMEKVEGFIAYLRELKADGWELRDPVRDDYGFVYKTSQSS